MNFNYYSFIILFYSNKLQIFAYNLLTIKVKNYEASTLQNKIIKHIYTFFT